MHHAIQIWQDLLTDAIAAESQGLMDDLQRRRGLAFGERPLCTVLRPRFLSPTQHRFLHDRTRILMRAFGKAYNAAIADASVLDQFMLLDWEKELIRIDHGYAGSCPTARLDAFCTAETEFKLTELNAETPAAAAYVDNIAEVFSVLPITREFLKRYRMISTPARQGVFHALIDAYQQWLGRRDAPRIAILDWREVPTYNEFVLFYDYFRANGLDCVIADPREVEYRDGKLLAGNYHITLIYKRVLISELVERGGMDHAIIRAVRDRSVCMVNPFRCKILYKKASLAVLSDERNAGLFDAAEQQAIAAHIPWTRKLAEGWTTFQGNGVDLVPFVHRNRERMVLKPNDDYGGKGIVLGWTVSENEWERAVHTALEEPYIVQERIQLPSEPYPSWIDGQVEWLDRMLDTAPFMCYGDYMEGCLTRISTAALLNVTAGGGSTVPTFVVEKR